MTRGEPRKIAHANRFRSFAACCGTPLFFEETKDSDTIDVTIASLDDPDLARGQIALGYDRRVASVIPEKLANFLTKHWKQPARPACSLRVGFPEVGS